MIDTNQEFEAELALLQPRELSPDLETRIQQRLELAKPQVRRPGSAARRVAVAVSAIAVCLVVAIGIRFLLVDRREVANVTSAPPDELLAVRRDSTRALAIRSPKIEAQTVHGSEIRPGLELLDHPDGMPIAEPRLSALLNDLASEDPDVRTKAALALATTRPLPASAIPALLKALDDRTPNSPIKGYAAGALSNIGPRAGEAVKSRVLKKLRVEDITSAELNEIHSLQEASVPALVELLDDPDPRLRTRGLGILCTKGASATSGAAAVEKRLADPDRGVRLAAARCFWTLTGDTKHTIPVLIAELKRPLKQGPDWSEAARTLGDIGPPAKEAVPLLIDLLLGTREKLPRGVIYRGPTFPWFHVRTEAAVAIGKIGPDAKAAISALLITARQLNQDSSSAAVLRVRSARALWRVAPTHPQAIPIVLDGLGEQPRSPWNLIATETVILIGAPAIAAVRTLIRQLETQGSFDRVSTIDALGIIGTGAKAAIPRLEELLEGEDLAVRKHAQLAITRIGPPEQSVLPLLEAASRTSFDVEVRRFLANRIEALRAKSQIP